MKLFFSRTVALLPGARNGATNPSSITVLEKSWRKWVRPKTDSLLRSEELRDQIRKEKAVLERRAQDLPNQPTQERMPVMQPKPLIQTEQLEADAIYIYKIKVRNNTAKTNHATGPCTFYQADWQI